MRTSVKTVAIWSVVPLLLAARIVGADSDVRLVEAAKDRNRVVVRALLKQHVDVNAAQPDGATALHWAAHWDDFDTTDLLIRAGAKVNVANDYGITPLSLACANGDGNAAVVERLLNAGADPNSARDTGETALMTAARSGSLEAVKLLLAREANVNATESRRGQTALMWAIAEQHPELVPILIEHGADIHIRSKGGLTAFLFAAQQGDVRSAQRLLAEGTDPNESMPDKTSALLLATSSGLQRFKTDDKGNNTVGVNSSLRGAVPATYQTLVSFLLEHGANPNAGDATGYTPLHAAVHHGGRKLVEALLSHGANPNAPLVANQPGMVGMVGTTPFLLAAFVADSSTMRLLVDAGADPLQKLSDNTTALMLAAGVHTVRLGDQLITESSALETVKVALDLGGDVNAVNEVGRTAMFGAADLGRDAVVQFLVDKGAAVELKDKNGDTPFSFTLRANHQSTGRLLQKFGADPTATLHCDSRLGDSVALARLCQ